MTAVLRLRKVRGVALLCLTAPPVNALSAELLSALAVTFDDLQHDSAITAVVLLAEGKFFSAGADLRDLGNGAAASLRAVCARIEGFDRPVIAAMQGMALGGGAELALAAHYRLAAPDAALGLPEVTLGLVPGAGATQRLPRLVGADMALRILRGGHPVWPEEGRRIGLIDGVISGDVPSAAVAFADGILARSAGPRPTRARRDRLADGPAYLACVAQHRKAARAGPELAPARIVDCVEAALLLPFATGLAFEAQALEDCLAHPQSRALRHIFLAERRISDQLLVRDTAAYIPTAPGVAVIAELCRALQQAVVWLRDQGHSPASIDATLCGFGFAAGPGGGTYAGPQNPVILRRCLAALLGHGTRLVARGAVARVSDIDALAVHGPALGFPRLWGGPMRAAQLLGLPGFRGDMRAWMLQDPVWSVSPLLDRAAQVAGGFDVS